MPEFQERAGIHHASQETFRLARRAGTSKSSFPPVAAIYGDNAAGKSNLLKCMNFFSNFVRNSFSLVMASAHSLSC
ncbi:MAG: AAA family ATPase [Bifidobacterium bifidum]